MKDGYLDARKSAEALIGIDEIFRYFLYKKSPELNSLEFDLPVRTRKGSWETLIPENIGEWIQLAMTTGGAYYAGSALKKMAQNDIGDSGFKDLFKGIVKGIKWVVQIGKHLKTLKKRKFDKVEFKETKGVQFVGIYNDEGEILYVPKIYLELFTEIPETIFNRLTQLVEEERKLKIGFSPSEKIDNDDTQKEVSISINEKGIFYKGKDEDDVLFPELVHNQYVELEGHITRGNENSNTIGFAYQNHILTCYPISGKIVEDRTYFFGDCIIRGYVNRMDKNGVYIEKRPRIAYMDILPTDKESNKDMFSK
ncbi:hypothetical protein N1F78_08425 [Seonamhaeicola sp. MEBiC1930]|uniref:hypothetical protein n=1 Tax=Seonamhaeicola sp. MEBiC01930 TaxID=2976768 RepID=UPI003246D9C9